MLIDVRSPLEFLMGHIKGSENIPLNKLPNYLEDIKAKNKPVLVYCASGMRSENASQLMNQVGQTHTFIFGGTIISITF
ncbi:MAG: rhodanese-like domain-containing protein [Flavobacteriales bacterium]